MGQAWKSAHPAVKALVALMALQVAVGLINIPLAFNKADDVLRRDAANGVTVDINTIKNVAVVGGAVFGALYIALALVLLRGKRWAWIVTLVLASLGVLSALVSLGNSNNRTALTPVGGAIIVAIFVLLLVRPVREHVRPQQPQFAGYGPYGGAPPGYGPPPGYAGPPPQAPPGWGQPQQQAAQQQGWGQPGVQPQAAPPSQSAPPPQAAPPSPPPAQGGFPPPS